ncbi:hypothetical protein ES703_44091 [subsurface metagenome]
MDFKQKTGDFSIKRYQLTTVIMALFTVALDALIPLI